MDSFSSIFLKGTIWRFIYYASSYVLNLCIAHQLKAAGSGNFYFDLNNLSILIFFLGFGVDSTVNFFNAKKAAPASQLLSVGVLWSMITVILFAIGYAIVSPATTFSGKIPFYYPAFFVFGSILTSIISSLFFSSRQPVIPNLIPTVFTLLLILSVLTGSVSSDRLLIIYLMAAGMPGLLLLVIYTINTRPDLSLKGLPWKEMVRYSWLAFFSNIVITLLMRADYWFVKSMASDTDLGNYIMTSKFAQLVVLIPSLGSFMLFPLITKEVSNKEITIERITKLCTLYFYQSLAICIVVVIVGYWLFPLLYGPTFDKMFLTFLLLIPGMLALSLTYPAAPFFSGINANKIIIYAGLAGLITMALANLVLIPWYSIYGAAIASSLSYFTYCAILLVQLKRHAAFKWKHLANFNFLYSCYNKSISLYDGKVLK